MKAENREKLREVLERPFQTVPGFQTSCILWQDHTDTAWLFAIFEDRAAYEKNADDPAQHERYLEYRGRWTSRSGTTGRSNRPDGSGQQPRWDYPPGHQSLIAATISSGASSWM